MKILGEKSLTSKVRVGLIILFSIISIIDISVIGIMIKKIKNIIQQNDHIKYQFSSLIFLTFLL